MSEPKPGDRVRVTYEATWREDTAIGFLATKGIVTHGPDPQWNYSGVPSHAIVEVLASPVYDNHDTTEHCIGDIVRTRSGVVMVQLGPDYYRRVPDEKSFERNELTRPLTLLVRDGQPVPAP